MVVRQGASMMRKAERERERKEKEERKNKFCTKDLKVRY